MVQFIQPNPRFGTSLPTGPGRLASLQVTPSGERASPVSRVLSGGTADNQTTALLGQNRQDVRGLGLPGSDGRGEGSGASLTLAGLDPASLYAVNRSLSSKAGIAGMVMAGMINPAFGLTALGTRYATDPNTFIGKQLYGQDAGFYQAASQGGPLNTPVAKPTTRAPYEPPRELTLDGGKSGRETGITTGSFDATYDNSRSGGDGGGTGAGVDSFGNPSRDRAGSFGDISGYGGYGDFGSTGRSSFEQGGPVPGRGEKEATVHGGEFVMTRDAVKGAGKGNMKKGHERLAKAMNRLATLGARMD